MKLTIRNLPLSFLPPQFVAGAKQLYGHKRPKLLRVILSTTPAILSGPRISWPAGPWGEPLARYAANRMDSGGEPDGADGVVMKQHALWFTLRGGGRSEVTLWLGNLPAGLLYRVRRAIRPDDSFATPDEDTGRVWWGWPEVDASRLEQLAELEPWLGVMADAAESHAVDPDTAVRWALSRGYDYGRTSSGAYGSKGSMTLCDCVPETTVNIAPLRLGEWHSCGEPLPEGLYLPDDADAEFTAYWHRNGSAKAVAS